MKLRHLESALEDVAAFDPEHQDYMLEQYPTSPHLAANLIHTAAETYGDIEGRSVVDYGCGCAMLSIAAAIMGASTVTGFDIDPNALAVAQENVEGMELEEVIDFVNCDVEHCSPARHHKLADTVVMNPPFGTRRPGIDMAFLQRGIQMATTAVYSLHKTSTRDHILKTVAEWGVQGEVIAELKFDIPAMYKFHTKKSVDVKVDLIRLDVTGCADGMEAIWQMPVCENVSVSDEPSGKPPNKAGKGKGSRGGKGKGGNKKRR